MKLRTEYLFFKLRDKLGVPFRPRKEVNKLGLKKGQTILDYGCGIGSYTFSVAKLVGERGKVYALDQQPLAIKKIEERTRMEGFNNVDTILSDGDTGLPNESVDVVLLYGVLPEIKRRGALLKELYRVLKPGGCLSTRFCFRMKKDKILEIVEGSKLFSLREQKGRILNFFKEKQRN